MAVSFGFAALFLLLLQGFEVDDFIFVLDLRH
jgi:hypothetical protein